MVKLELYLERHLLGRFIQRTKIGSQLLQGFLTYNNKCTFTNNLVEFVSFCVAISLYSLYINLIESIKIREGVAKVKVYTPLPEKIIPVEFMNAFIENLRNIEDLQLYCVGLQIPLGTNNKKEIYFATIMDGKKYNFSYPCNYSSYVHLDLNRISYINVRLCRPSWAVKSRGESEPVPNYIKKIVHEVVKSYTFERLEEKINEYYQIIFKNNGRAFTTTSENRFKYLPN